MEQKGREIRSIELDTPEGRFTLFLEEEDFSGVYPGMVRFTLTVNRESDRIALFRANSYEYSPTVPLDARTDALRKADAWEHALRTDPKKFVLSHTVPPRKTAQGEATDLVVIQGSPRADGNCAVIAGWAADTARKAGKTVQVIFPHDLEIHHCIGCYQCYNSGTCVFNDDMAGVIYALKHASLVIVCSPVYTNTVPAGLKLLFDRCQAYHAERTLTGGNTAPKGLLFSVAGRTGMSNFACVSGVIGPFMRNIGIVPSGEVLIDGIDTVHDVRKLPGTEEKIRSLVRETVR